MQHTIKLLSAFLLTLTLALSAQATDYVVTESEGVVTITNEFGEVVAIVEGNTVTVPEGQTIIATLTPDGNVIIEDPTTATAEIINISSFTSKVADKTPTQNTETDDSSTLPDPIVYNEIEEDLPDDFMAPDAGQCPTGTVVSPSAPGGCAPI